MRRLDDLSLSQALLVALVVVGLLTLVGEYVFASVRDVQRGVGRFLWRADGRC